MSRQEASTSTGITYPAPTSILVGLDNISPFDGTGNIQDFLEIIEQSAILGNWTEQQKVAITRLKLKGLAKLFVDAEPDLKQTVDWNFLKRNLQNQYKKKEIPGQALRKFLECKQQHGENCRNYLTRVKVAANGTVTYTGDDTYDRILKIKLEEDTCKQFVMGLLDPIRRRVLSAEPATLEEALNITEKEEMIESITNPSINRQAIRGIANSPNFEQKWLQPKRSCQAGTNNIQVGGRARGNNIKCFNCNRMGHFARHCRIKDMQQETVQEQRDISYVKCFRCNKLGHFAHQCTTNGNEWKNNVQKCFGCLQPELFINSCRNKQKPLNDKAATLQPRGAAAEEMAEEW